MNRFLVKTPENADFNQYWYSADTIAAIVDEYDKQWGTDPGFTFYDFNAPDALPAALLNSFDLIVIDPPFITREVWEKYAVTARLLARPGPLARFLASTTAENEGLMAELLGAVPQAFKPSIPNLVYQYNMYANFPCVRLSVPNPEIPE